MRDNTVKQHSRHIVLTIDCSTTSVSIGSSRRWPRQEWTLLLRGIGNCFPTRHINRTSTGCSSVQDGWIVVEGLKDTNNSHIIPEVILVKPMACIKEIIHLEIFQIRSCLENIKMKPTDQHMFYS